MDMNQVHTLTSDANDEAHYTRTKTQLTKLSTAYLKVQKAGVSLFWMEKVVMLIRVYQLYALFFLFYYEFFPESARKHLRPVMMTFLGSWHIMGDR